VKLSVFLVAAASSCFIGKVIVNIPYGVIFSREKHMQETFRLLDLVTMDVA
jgi:hypothetical protein